MASESLTQQKIGRLQEQMAAHTAIFEERGDRFNATEAELRGAVAALMQEVRTLRADVATVTAHNAALQRQSDRGWNLWQALLVVALSVAASSITQLALRK